MLQVSHPYRPDGALLFKVPSTLCALLYTPARWLVRVGFYSSPFIRRVCSRMQRRRKDSSGSPLAAFLMSSISSDVNVDPTTRSSSGGEVSLVKKFVISFQRLSGMLVQDSQLYAEASDTPSFSANSRLVRPSLASHIFNCVLLFSVSSLFISRLI